MVTKFNSTEESRFYYPLYITRNGSTAQVFAKFRENLPVQQIGVTDSVIILSSDLGLDNQGLYLHDGSRWRWILPQTVISQCAIEGSRLHIYYDQTSDLQLPDDIQLYRNGALVEGSTTVTTERNAVWVSVAPLDVHTGNVQTVNDKTPDSDGNVELGIEDIPGLEEALESKYYQIAVSLPFDIEPSQLLFYQVVDRALHFNNGSGSVSTVTSGTVLSVTKNGGQVGEIFIGSDRSVIFHMSDPEFNNGDVLGLVSQDTVNSLSVASFLFNFDLTT